MIVKIFGIHLLLNLILLFSDVHAQFMNFQIEIEPRVDAVVNQQLNFGQLVGGSGLQEITLGSPNMGIFHIRALRTQHMMISVEPDSVLIHENRALNASIPMQIYANYTNYGIDDYRNSIAFSDGFESIVIEAPPNTPESQWSGLYIYIYGTIDLRNVPLGLYSGEIRLTIVYE